MIKTGMPKFLSVFILVIGLVAAVFLVSQQTNFFSRAAFSTAPSQIQISNITDNSFTVSWVTKAPALGFVHYGLGPDLGLTSVDDREVFETQPGYTHHITIRDLEPDTLYYYKINSGGDIFDDQSEPFTQKTARIYEGSVDEEFVDEEPVLGEAVINGVIEKEDGGVPSEALVYLRAEGSSVLSTYIDSEGNWLFPLINLRSEDLESRLTLNNDQQLSLTIEAGEDGLERVDFTLDDMAAVERILLKPVAAEELVWPADFNQDGTINAIDFGFYIKQKLSL